MSGSNLQEEDAEEMLEGLNPSAKLAYKVLEKEGSEMTKTELEEETLLDSSTLREAMNSLENEGVAYKRKGVMDNRQKIYGLSTEEFETPEYTFLE